MKIKSGMEEEYKRGYNNNLDAYGHAVYTFAERWAESLERDIERVGDPVDAIINNAERRERQVDDEIGITGFMYGCAVNILAHCWEYGEILRKWHNKEYNYEGDGVVNPALLKISLK